MEVPRLDHTLNSPTSPCEEVIKNLSLEAIQLCDRDGKSDGGCKEGGRARGQSPRPPRLCLPRSPGHQGLFCPPFQINTGGLLSAHPPSPQKLETKGPRGSLVGAESRVSLWPRRPWASSPAWSRSEELPGRGRRSRLPLLPWTRRFRSCRSPGFQGLSTRTKGEMPSGCF